MKVCHTLKLKWKKRQKVKEKELKIHDLEIAKKGCRKLEACLSLPGKQGLSLSVKHWPVYQLKYINNLASLRFSQGNVIEWDNLVKTAVWQDVV